MNHPITRRHFITTAGTLAAGLAFMPNLVLGSTDQPRNIIQRAIPSSGEMLPVIGMGTSRTFNVDPGGEAMSGLAEVMSVFLQQGGRLIDSSPMYGSSEEVVGDLLRRRSGQAKWFAATKVWTDGREAGLRQVQRSMRRLGVQVMDLMQIHNLRDWQTHLPVLRELKQQGTIRYIGITTSHGRFHGELERILKTEPLDFVQLSYNIDNREAEKRLLPIAADRGIATLINRPFQRGSLFSTVRGKTLPEWSRELDIDSWGQFFLKFIIAHPAVTCVIPATSKSHHMKDNMGAQFGKLPDTGIAKKMLHYYAGLS